MPLRPHRRRPPSRCPVGRARGCSGCARRAQTSCPDPPMPGQRRHSVRPRLRCGRSSRRPRCRCRSACISLTRYLIEEQREKGVINTRSAPADRGRGARLQDHRDPDQQGRPRRRARQCRFDQRAGRGAEEARRAQQRDPARSQRMGRPPGRDRLRGNGRSVSDPASLSEGRIPARVRSARRLLEHRRQRVGRHHLLGAEGAGRRDRTDDPRTSCSRAPGRSRPATRSTVRARCWC
jgi:hypothetical protein